MWIEQVSLLSEKMILNQAKLIELAALLTMLNGFVRDALKMTIERADKFLRKDVICAIIDIANRGENAEGFIPGVGCSAPG